MSPANGLTAVAMSGGLDSSVAAWMLSRERPVVGLSMLLWDRSANGTGEPRSGRCCGALDLGDARRVAGQCGFPHYTLEMEEDFRRYVVDPFVDAYLAGRTPVPCTSCNTWVKFDLFVERARRLGAERIATGHYARIVAGDEGPELHRAVNAEKDQSYYLFELSQEQLAAAEFPLGELSKTEVRQMASDAGLVVAEKAESMEICFVDGGVREFVEREAGRRNGRLARASLVRLGAPSRVVDGAGHELGRGEPYYRYTVGQRRGLGIAAAEPLYVQEVRPAENAVVAGPRAALDRRGLVGERLHWIGSPPAPGEDGRIEVEVKIRARHPGVGAWVRPLTGGRAEVEFAAPQRGVAPGQAAVFYRESRVLGGCWIENGMD